VCKELIRLGAAMRGMRIVSKHAGFIIGYSYKCSVKATTTELLSYFRRPPHVRKQHRMSHRRGKANCLP
jgi:hypothetical protein